VPVGAGFYRLRPHHQYPQPLCFKFNPALAQIPALQVLAVAGNAIFWGMNLFVGFNTAKEFGGSPILGGVMAAVISHPGLANITLFGDKLVPGRGGIIAVLLIAFLCGGIRKMAAQTCTGDPGFIFNAFPGSAAVHFRGHRRLPARG
jgi:hypothetical protein